MNEIPVINEQTPMREVLVHFPSAQRALFAKYHIGGCRSCSFDQKETVAELCARNENIPVDEMLEVIRESYVKDQSLFVAATEVAGWIEQGAMLLDMRTREEYDAVHIVNALSITQELIQEGFTKWAKDQKILIYDHRGEHVLDVVAYFQGHGFAETKGIRGGIDAYSVEVDSSLPRYRIELE
jgi:rhodanese-related sulfurtransferase